MVSKQCQVNGHHLSTTCTGHFPIWASVDYSQIVCLNGVEIQLRLR